MSTSAILGITEIAQNQANRYITLANLLAALEQAANRKFTKAVAGTGPVTLTQTEVTRNVYLELTVGTSSDAFNVVYPDVVDVINSAERIFVVKNSTLFDATVKATSAGTTVVIRAGGVAWIQQSGVNMTRLTYYDGGTTAPYDIGCFVPGLPDAGVTCLTFVATRAITFADDFLGSRGFVGVNPTATAAFDILRNGSSIGSISISTGGAFTFNTTGAGVSLAVGDRISLTTPSPQDTTLSNVSITLFGSRTL